MSDKNARDGINFERMSAVRSIFIEHDQVKKVMQGIRRLHRISGAGDLQRCVLFVGPSRSGKSKTLREYAAKFPPTSKGDHDEQPVLLVEAPAPCTIKS